MEEIKLIVDLMIEDLCGRLEDRKIELQITGAARDYVARDGYNPVYGARPLKRFLQREVETRVGRALIGGDILDGSRVVVDVVDDTLDVHYYHPEIESEFKAV